MFDNKQKYLRELISKIKRLNVKEKQHILSVFKKYNVEYTKNSNGYFFNLDKIDYTILDKVSKCVDLIEEKRELITTLDKKRDSYLEYYKNLIENKLKDTVNKKRIEYINQLVLIPSDNYIKKKVTKKVTRFGNLDPDILMKEHNKPKKYHKNSPYFRINQTMYMLSRKTKRYVSDKSNKDDDGGGFIDNYDEDGEGGNNDIEDVEDNGDIEGLNDELQESLGEEYLDESDNDDNTSSVNDYCEDSEMMGEDEYYKDTNSDTESEFNKTDKTDKSDNKTTTKTTKNKKKKLKEASSNEIDYYKTLLKQNGFKFDDDKSVRIQREEYIE
jgi:hypothetical protein